ncbi:MAG: ferrous iron transport protein A [Oscillospiraceae bacterium]|nr:ferrous iron transport protein A [Oscillospiraceae bacterium]MBR2929241.1 ferrous iron transport protein A [Oscillospiraceae bacterium]MBR6677972.1 ferrous iron transport protein A [Oscillospiraceae bacterium]
MNLMNAAEGREWIIRDINTQDEELNAFLFSLGCYTGEPITVVSRRKNHCVVSIKDGRYNIDSHLAAAILV